MTARTRQVRIEVGEKIIAVPRRSAQSVRGALVGNGHRTTALKFAASDSDKNVVLSREDKQNVLGAIFAVMQTGSDQRARDLLPLRNALRDNLSRRHRAIG